MLVVLIVCDRVSGRAVWGIAPKPSLRAWITNRYIDFFSGRTLRGEVPKPSLCACDIYRQRRLTPAVLCDPYRVPASVFRHRTSTAIKLPDHQADRSIAYKPLELLAVS